MNTYGYVYANPIKSIDPFGLYAKCPPGQKAYFIDPEQPHVFVCKPYPDYTPPKPDFGTHPSSEMNCNVECNIKYQPICTGLAVGVGTLTTPAGGAAAGGGCIFIKVIVCESVCDDDGPKQCSNKE